MPWGKMDDKFHSNAKTKALRKTAEGRLALGTWVYWWSRVLDDPEWTGVVPEHELTPFDAKAAKELVRVGLWDEHADGFRYHDFEKWNPDPRTKKERDAARYASKSTVSSRRTHGGTKASPPLNLDESEASSSPPQEEGGGVSDSAFEGDEDQNVFGASADRWQLWSREYTRLYKIANKSVGLAKGPKFAEHVNALRDWSIEAALTDEQCQLVLERFFADRDPERVGDKHWIGFLPSRADDYLKGSFNGSNQPVPQSRRVLA